MEIHLALMLSLHLLLGNHHFLLASFLLFSHSLLFVSHFEQSLFFLRLIGLIFRVSMRHMFRMNQVALNLLFVPLVHLTTHGLLHALVIETSLLLLLVLVVAIPLVNDLIGSLPRFLNFFDDLAENSQIL